jgi:pimeloyl-ACP methyl ester carboxylesterase
VKLDENAELSRVASTDGTDIALWTSGVGKPLVLVHGGAADHTRWRPLP